MAVVLPDADRGRSVARALLVFAAALAVALGATLRGGGLDDAFITYTFARNLAAGHGLTWSPGEPAVYGFSTVLHVLALACAGRAGLDIPTTSLVLGGVGWAAAAALLFDWVRRDHGLLRAALFAALDCVSLRAVNLSLGMETGVYVFLVVATLRAAVTRRPMLAGAVAGLACIARPDGVLAAAVAALVLVRTRDGARARAARFAAAAAAVVLPAAWFLHHTFGTVIPQTIAAKRHGFATAEAFGPRGLVHWVGEAARDGGVLGAWILVAGAVAGLARVGVARPWRGSDAFLAWGVLYCALFWLGGPPEAWWYYAALLPALHLAFVMGALGPGGGLGADRPARRAATMAGLAAVAALGLIDARATARQLARDPLGTLSAASEDHRRIAEAIVGDLARRGRATGSVLAYEVGHLGYLVPGRVDDMVGLVSREPVEQGPVRGALTLLRRAPDYVVLKSDPHFRPIAAVAQSPELVLGYEAMMSRPFSGGMRQLIFRRRARSGHLIAVPLAVAVPVGGSRVSMAAGPARVAAVCLGIEAEEAGAFDAVVEKAGGAIEPLALYVERGPNVRCGTLTVPAAVDGLAFPPQSSRAGATVTSVAIMTEDGDTRAEATLRCLEGGDGTIEGLRPYSIEQGVDFISVEEGRFHAHPPSGVVLGIALGGRPGALRFTAALDPNTPRAFTDGVTFEVLVDGSRQFRAHVVPANSYSPREVPLPAKDRVEVALLTGPGPRGDVGSDWAIWDGVSVVVGGVESVVGRECPPARDF